MYHVKKDKRSQTSAKLIMEGVERCLKKKSFNDLTITDVQKEAAVGRATFYRLFDNLTDVLAYQCDQHFKEAIDIENRDLTYEEHIKAFITHWMNASDLLETVIQSGHVELIFQSHNQSLDALKKGFLKNNDVPEADSDYFSYIMPSVMIGILAAWIQRGKKETAADLVEFLKRASLVNYDLLIQRSVH